jgi:hypothetical protein
MKIDLSIKNVSSYLPNKKGKEILIFFGEDLVKRIATSIMSGGNLRDVTDNLTRKRLALSNAAIFYIYIKNLCESDDFTEKFYDILSTHIKSTKKKDQKNILLWFSGLTNKGIDNLTRGKSEKLINYFNDQKDIIDQVSDKLIDDFGNLDLNLKLEGKDNLLSWKSILQILTAAGAQTLFIRGSEKSMYGKLFEKITLGIVLQLLDFKLIDKNDSTCSENVFWLNSKTEQGKREKDATLLYRLGKGINFDIGFIGRGNPEITHDKKTRFSNQETINKEQHRMFTIILIDSLGRNSNVPIKEEHSEVVQMSMTYWVFEIAKILEEKLDYRHEILKLTQEDSIPYIENKIKDMDLKPLFERIS